MKIVVQQNEDNGVEWRNEEGQLHRENGPAVEKLDGTKMWYLNGQQHRENGPAVESADGGKIWLSKGYIHREDGPAIEGEDGSRAWYQHGKPHRENGPAIEYADGRIEYCVRGLTDSFIEQQVKENMARLEKQKLLDQLSQDDTVSERINRSSLVIHKKL